ncbi:MAG: hypothetical protein AAGI44_07530 [Pseudomonadota bacterium]
MNTLFSIGSAMLKYVVCTYQGYLPIMRILACIGILISTPSIAQTVGTNKNCMTGADGGSCTSDDVKVPHNYTGVITAACQNNSALKIDLHCFWKTDKNDDGCQQNIEIGPGSHKCECPNHAEAGGKVLKATVTCHSNSE